MSLNGIKQALRGREFTVLLVIILIYYIGFILYHQLSYLLDPDFISLEALETYVFFRGHEAPQFKDDLLSSYFSSIQKPYLYEAMHHAWIALFGDELLYFHIGLSIFLWLAVLIGLGLCGGQILGGLGAFSAVFFGLLHTNIFLYKILTAEAHSFAFPLMVFSLWALLRGNLVLLGILALSSALLYPALSLNVGLMWAAALLWNHKEKIIARPVISLAQLGALIGALGFVCIVFGYEAVFQPDMEKFGVKLGYMERSDDHPETGKGGVYEAIYNYNYERIFFHYARIFSHNLSIRSITDYFGAGQGANLTKLYISLFMGLIMAGLSIYGLSFLKRRQIRQYKAILLYLIANFVPAVLLALFMPQEIYRFVMYPFVPLLVLLVPVGLYGLVARFMSRQNIQVAYFVVLLACAPFFSAVHVNTLGYKIYMDDSLRNVFEKSAALPADAMVASWPFPVGDMIPYLAQRKTFLATQAWNGYYTGFTPRLRERMMDFMEAYLGRDKIALEKLRDKWGVDYVLVDQRHLSGDDSKSPFFHMPPYQSKLESLWFNNKGHFWLSHPPQEAVIGQTGPYYLLALDEI